MKVMMDVTMQKMTAYLYGNRKQINEDQKQSEKPFKPR